jgi:hypothetical protein
MTLREDFSPAQEPATARFSLVEMAALSNEELLDVSQRRRSATTLAEIDRHRLYPGGE